MDRVMLRGIKVFGHHGHTQQERDVGQVLEVDVDLEMDLRRAGASDSLEHTADWQDVYQVVSQVVSEGRQHLLEAVAEDIASRLLRDGVQTVRVAVWKPLAPIGGVCDRVGAEIERRRDTA